MALRGGEREEEEEEEEALKTSAMLTAAAAQQWEESLEHLKHELNQCGEETKVRYWVKKRKEGGRRVQSADRRRTSRQESQA
jgi:hypothetical protein|eukprot:evm.model.NODE_29353_length_14271_cov_25.066639.3